MTTDVKIPTTTHPAVAELEQLLALEQLTECQFLGHNESSTGSRLFGGQILAQALRAAGLTSEGRVAHSLHAYFVRPGSVKSPVLYEVDLVRDGRSFSARNVRAIQSERVIFTAQVSLQVPEQGLEHQVDGTRHAAPETLRDDVDIVRGLSKEKQAGMPWMLRERAFEVRSLNQVTKFPDEPVKPAWLRARSKLSDDPFLHQCLLSYATDMGLMSTCLIPHLKNRSRSAFRGVSLDHSIWFHREFRADQWLMYDRESPILHRHRGFNRGTIYDSSGQLVASVMQECLARLDNRA